MASCFAFFARAIYRGDAPYLLGTSRFTDCEDFRKGCSRVADNDTCTGANSCGQSFNDE